MDSHTEEFIADLAGQTRGRYWGKYRATVENPKDDDKLGRITVKCPAVYHDMVSPWAYPVSPFAGPGYGWFMLPKKGDGVWIEFEGGQPAHPVWSGFWYAHNEIPAPGDENVRVLVTPQGLKLVFDDKSKKLQLLHPGGGELTMTDNDVTLKFGSTSIVLSASGAAINDTAFKVT
jgi:uncharacterized protein involved in type VI secretion and phage assembly